MEDKKKDEILKACQDIIDQTGIGRVVVRVDDDQELTITREVWVRNPNQTAIDIAISNVGNYKFGGLEVAHGRYVLLKKRKTVKI